MPSDPKKLARIHRVRTLQLNLTRADEAAAHDRVASETALSQRIAGLAAAVGPTPGAREAFNLSAAAHYRQRLSESAVIAVQRVQAAEANASRAAEATRAAKRDQSAVEKLIARADAAAVMKAIRALEDQPAVRRKRHDPC
jgi:flagellar protein FliJ